MIDIRRWRLYVVTDAALSRGRSEAEIVRAAIEGGANAIQYREKDDRAPAQRETALALQAICREAGAAFIINDRPGLAASVSADGVHVGQGDMPARRTRQLIGPNRILGVSATNLDEALRAQADGADYLGVGPVFDARQTKPDAARPIGIEGLSEICRATDLPVIAIGGIDANNIAEVIRAGATGVAVISAVVSAPDVCAAAKKLCDALTRPRGKPKLPQVNKAEASDAPSRY